MERVLPASATTVAASQTRALTLDGVTTAVGAWTLGCAPVASLGLAGGGFDVVVRTQVGLAAWWVLLLGALVGVLPLVRLRGAGIAVVAAFAAFALLAVASGTWAADPGRATAESAREVTLLALLVLAAVGIAPGRARTLVCGAYAGLVVVALVALATRIVPTWLGPDVTGALLSGTRDRLSRPLNYWNALGALVAMALPLGLGVALSARTAAGRAAALAPLPALVLVLGLTLSRGAIAAGAVALLAALLLTPRRWAWSGLALLAGAGATIVLAAAGQRGPFRTGAVDALTVQSGRQMLVVLVVCCGSVAAVAAATWVVRAAELPRAPERVLAAAGSRTTGAVLGTALLIAAASAAATVDWGMRWARFTDPASVANGTDRLASGGGNGRWQLWSAAWDAFASSPLHGLGSGGYAAFRAEHAVGGGAALNAHQLYVETLADLGVLGGALLAAALGAALLALVRATRGTDAERRPVAAGAAAAVVALLAACAVDWDWQVTVLPACALLLVGAFVPKVVVARSAPRVRPRVALALVALVAGGWSLVPLAAAGTLRASAAAAAAGDVTTALRRSDDAAAAQPYAAAPLLQRGLVLERAGDLDGAALALRAAGRRATGDWHIPYVLARVEARRGDAAAALAAFRRARALNPRSGALR